MVCYVIGTLAKTLHSFSPVILSGVVWRESFHHPPFKDKDAEA